MAENAPIIVKKIKKGHEGHHGGAWKVAYADFVTAMMAFFLVMWIIGLDSETRRAIEGYFQDPAGFVRTSRGQSGPLIGGAKLSPGRPARPSQQSTSEDQEVADRSRLREVKQSIERQLASAPDLQSLKDNVEIKFVEDGLRMELLEGPEPVFFLSGSAKLQPQAEHLLAIIAQKIGPIPNRVALEGHTDRKPYDAKANYTNWELSSDRANSARRFMETKGLPNSHILEVRGYADKQPRVPSNPYHFSNRRVSILVMYGAIAGAVEVKDPQKQPVDPKIAPQLPDIRREKTNANAKSGGKKAH